MENILEYYEELFPVSDAQKDFFFRLLEKATVPQKVLSIGCGAGTFEHMLSRKGCDVTGIDEIPQLLESASRRRRIPGVTIRFFNMSTLDMTRFLGGGFYTLILCLNNRIAKIRDRVLLRKFFCDCKSLLAQGGVFAFQVPNYLYFSEEPVSVLPATQSIRAKLHTKIITAPDGEKMLLQQVETSNGRLVTVAEISPFFAITTQDIQEFAYDAGFKNIEFFGGYDMSAFDPDSSLNLVCLLS